MLKRARGYSLMTQQELAERLGRSKRSVASWEAGDHDQPVTVVLDWLRLCNRPLDELKDVLVDLRDHGKDALTDDDHNGVVWPIHERRGARRVVEILMRNESRDSSRKVA